MTARLTPERPNESVPHRPNPMTDVEEGFCFCLLLFAVLLFFVRHFFLFLAFWFVSCEPEISPRSFYLFFIVLFFVFSRKNGVRFFVCFAFCLLLLLFQSIFKLLIIIFNFTYFLLLLLFVFN